MVNSIGVRPAVLSVTAVLFGAAPSAAQSGAPTDGFAGWPPVISPAAEAGIIPAWSAAASGGRSRGLSPAVDVSGWYVPAS
jgi:hypothetical protein